MRNLVDKTPKFLFLKDYHFRSLIADLPQSDGKVVADLERVIGSIVHVNVNDVAMALVVTSRSGITGKSEFER